MSPCRSKAPWHSTLLLEYGLVETDRTAVEAATRAVQGSPTRRLVALLWKEVFAAEGEACSEGEAKMEVCRRACPVRGELAVVPPLSQFLLLPRTPAG